MQWFVCQAFSKSCLTIPTQKFVTESMLWTRWSLFFHPSRWLFWVTNIRCTWNVLKKWCYYTSSSKTSAVYWICVNAESPSPVQTSPLRWNQLVDEFCARNTESLRDPSLLVVQVKRKEFGMAHKKRNKLLFLAGLTWKLGFQTDCARVG